MYVLVDLLFKPQCKWLPGNYNKRAVIFRGRDLLGRAIILMYFYNFTHGNVNEDKIKSVANVTVYS